jgi:hypothetical protein
MGSTGSHYTLYKLCDVGARSKGRGILCRNLFAVYGIAASAGRVAGRRPARPGCRLTSYSPITRGIEAFSLWKRAISSHLGGGLHSISRSNIRTVLVRRGYQ